MNEESVKKEILNDNVKEALVILAVIVFFVICVVYNKHVTKQEEMIAEKNAVVHSYQVAENGFKNMLYSQYGDVEVTNEDWGSHSSYGEGDAFGEYLNKVYVNGVGADEIVLIQYYTRNNGADNYAVAELTEGDSRSNGWIVHRDGSKVVFDTDDSSRASTYDSYGIYNVTTNKLYLPKYDFAK